MVDFSKLTLLEDFEVVGKTIAACYDGSIGGLDSHDYLVIVFTDDTYGVIRSTSGYEDSGLKLELDRTYQWDARDLTDIWVDIAAE